MGAVAEAEQAVVRAHVRVPAAFDRRRTPSVASHHAAPSSRLRAAMTTWSGSIASGAGAASLTGATSPRMQLTLLPPIQNRPSSRDTCTRPARPSFAPCAAT